jgi:hypothetical protein
VADRFYCLRRRFIVRKIALAIMLGILLSAGPQVPTASAIEFIAPEIGGDTVTIVDAALPSPPGGKEAASNQPVIRLWGSDKAATAKVGRAKHKMALVVFGHYTMVSGAYRTDWSAYQASSVPFDITLQRPVSESSILFAADLWDGTSNFYWYRYKSSPELEVVGFDAGATSIQVNNLEEGARLFSLHMSPGHQPIGTWVTEGSWQDADEEANGVLVTSVLRNTGPPHVLPGDIWWLGVESETGSAGLWAATGDTVRYTVPVASHVIGSSGTPFISDLVISNPFGITTSGWIRFVQENQPWDQAAEMTFSLDPGETTSWVDVLDSGFGITANVKGTLQVGGFPPWTLKVSSRNYAISEGQQFGIAIPGFATFEPMTGTDIWVIPGLMENAQFRSNFIAGGAIPQASEITIRLIVNGSVLATITRTVPGYGLLQINRIASNMGVSTVNDGYLEITIDSGAVFAALSVVDGTADDAAYIVAQRLLQ